MKHIVDPTKLEVRRKARNRRRKVREQMDAVRLAPPRHHYRLVHRLRDRVGETKSRWAASRAKRRESRWLRGVTGIMPESAINAARHDRRRQRTHRRLMARR